MDLHQTASFAVSAVQAQTDKITQTLEEYKKVLGAPPTNTIPPFLMMDTVPVPPSQYPPTPRPPTWLIFEEYIINTSHIQSIQPKTTKTSTKICIAMCDGKKYNIPVKNIKDIWAKLQRVFAFGVTKKDNEQTTEAVQKDGNRSDTRVADSSGK
jgi:hypothetical protein